MRPSAEELALVTWSHIGRVRSQERITWAPPTAKQKTRVKTITPKVGLTTPEQPAPGRAVNWIFVGLISHSKASFESEQSPTSMLLARKLPFCTIVGPAKGSERGSKRTKSHQLQLGCSTNLVSGCHNWAHRVSPF